jgi:hypothetical protein
LPLSSFRMARVARAGVAHAGASQLQESSDPANPIAKKITRGGGHHQEIEELEAPKQRTVTDRLRERFEKFDVDGSKFLSKREIYNGLTRPTATGGRSFKTAMYDQFLLFFSFEQIDKE